ncbi:unnamed protein product [Owenia fusiformis]|uniref:Guanine nucleotide exchange factor MSS4 n=1 Tax=Owenia fusiformis TaxID=6347 RepID=A0A8J1TTW4_OWEFU|nr:unnamed protein product [Owenia fusiformis]
MEAAQSYSVDRSTLPKEVAEQVKDCKNVNSVVCERCQSVVLKPLAATFVQKKAFLPHMKKKSDDQTIEDGEMLQNYWVVADMFDFENVGFLKTVGTIKYLICADCEVGPIGYQNLEDKTALYVSLDRVKHLYVSQ